MSLQTPRRPVDGPSDPPASGPSKGSERPDSLPSKGRSRFWTFGFPVVFVCLAGLVTFLAWIGKEAVLDSSDGKVVEAVIDPNAPGYQALVSPTETALVVQTNNDGQLVAVTFLSISGEATTSAMSIPPGAVSAPREEGGTTLGLAWADGGLPALTAAVEQMLGVGIGAFAPDGSLIDGDVFQVSTADWESLVAPVAPFLIENPDDASRFGPNGEVLTYFAPGAITLDAETAGEYFEASIPGENDLNRMARHQEFWRAWIEAIRAGGIGGQIPGESTSGLGRFVDAMARGEVSFVALPAQAYPIPGGDEIYLPDQESLKPLIAAMVPFPSSPSPGERTTLRVLDGSGKPGIALAVAPEIAAEANGEIVLIGNAANFDYASSQVLYHSPANEAAAQSVAEVLGVSDVILVEDPDETIMVTVIIGGDLA